jgi:rhodanese-related sulfurtransferase
MSVKRVSPEEAQKLMNDEGYVYVDVRSVPEFEAGHPTGAFNVPWMHLDSTGYSENPDFVAVMERTFGKGAKVVLGCKSGGRSLAAAEALREEGFTAVVDQRAGFVGTFGPQGPESGWAPKGLPTSQAPTPGRAYSDLAPKDP